MAVIWNLRRARVWALVAAALVVSRVALAPAQGLLQVESNDKGEIRVEARGVPLEETLAAVGEKVGIKVEIDRGLRRPAVNVVTDMVPIEEALRQILRGRNYALIYDAQPNDTSRIRRVIVLPPSTRSTYQPPRPRRRPAYRNR